MITDKVNNAQSWAALESVFWLAQNNLGESTAILLKDAEARYMAAMDGGTDKEKVTAANDLISLVGWCKRQGIAYQSIMETKGQAYKSAESLLEPANNRVDWGRLGKDAYTEILTAGSEKLPSLLTDNGELTQDFKNLIQDYRKANDTINGPESEENRELYAANDVIRQFRSAYVNEIKITASTHPELIAGLKRYFPDEIAGLNLNDSDNPVKATHEIKLTLLQKKKDFYEKRATEAFVKGRDAAKQKLMDTVHGALLSISPITEAMAEAWAAKKVRVEQAAAQELTSIAWDKSLTENGNPTGYILNTDELIAHSKEYYRLVGGKVTPIRFYRAQKDDRAHAYSNPGSDRHHQLNVGAKLNKTILFHELAHFAETDCLIAASNRYFRDNRAISKRVKKLSTITGNRRFKPYEVALEDHWISPYVGKVYQDGITEVGSMALQYLAKAADIAKLAEKDPSMLAYALALAANPGVPESRAALENMEELAIAADGKNDVPEELQARKPAYDRLVSRLLSEIKWTRDSEGNYRRKDKPSEGIAKVPRSKNYSVNVVLIQKTPQLKWAKELFVRQKLAQHYGMEVGQDIFSALPDNFRVSDVVTWKDF